MLTKLDTLLMFYSLAAAYGERDKWGIGATLQLAHQPKTELSLVVDAVPNGPLSPYYNRGADVVSTISMAAPPAPTALLGAWYRFNDQWEVAASGRVLPAQLHNTGTFVLNNTDTGPNFSAEKLAVKGQGASMDLVLPPTARLGVRYRQVSGQRELWDVELNAVYEAWHLLDDYQVRLKGTILLFPGEKQAPTVTIPKRWSDTLALRLDRKSTRLNSSH